MDLVNLQNFQNNLFLKIIFFILFVWSLIWKGVALWHGATNKEKNWFIAILILNTEGILEISYLFFFSKNKLNAKEEWKKIKSKISRQLSKSQIDS